MGNKAFDPQHTRLFALAGHRSTGKTSLAEVLFQTTGVTRTIGRVDDGTSLLDHRPGERRRGMTLELGFAWMPWQDHLLQLVDTPGSEGLAHQRRLAFATVDAAVVVVSAPDGVEYGTERVLEETRVEGLARLVVVNRAERLVDPQALVAAIEEAAGVRALPVQLPYFDDEGRFSGVINLLEPDGEPRVYRYDLCGGNAFSPEPLPERARADAHAAWERLQEAVALADDALLEDYLEFLVLAPAQVHEGLARLVRRGEVVPVLFASAALAIGAHPLLDAIVSLLPSPLERAAPVGRGVDGEPLAIRPDDPFLAQVIASSLDDDGKVVQVLRVWSGQPPRNGQWVDANTGARFRVGKLYQVRGPRRAMAHTTGPGAVVATWDVEAGRPGDTYGVDGSRIAPAPPVSAPMVSYLLDPVGPRDKAALPAAVERLCLLDGALSFTVDPLTSGIVLHGQDDVHLGRALDRLQHRFGLHIRAALPPVPYRETPSGAASRVRGVYREEAGALVSAFGECWLDIVPQHPEAGVRFENRAEPDSLPVRFIHALDAGIRDASRHGPTAGYPVTGVGVRCVDGEYDMLSSEDDHFRQAGAVALRAALEQTGTELLEPWSLVRIEVGAPEVGPVLTEVGSRRGRILDMQVGARHAVIEAHLPFREVRVFAPRLQAAAGGRGRFTASHSHYEKLPIELVREAIDQSPWRAQAQQEPSGGNGRVAEYNG